MRVVTWSLLLYLNLTLGWSRAAVNLVHTEPASWQHRAKSTQTLCHLKNESVRNRFKTCRADNCALKLSVASLLKAIEVLLNYW